MADGEVTENQVGPRARLVIQITFEKEFNSDPSIADLNRFVYRVFEAVDGDYTDEFANGDWTKLPIVEAKEITISPKGGGAFRPSVHSIETFLQPVEEYSLYDDDKDDDEDLPNDSYGYLETDDGSRYIEEE